VGRAAARFCRFSAGLILSLAPSVAGAGEIGDEFYFDATTPTPAAVLALQDCDAVERTAAHRKPFAGGSSSP
jgi:hypothetical protein